MFALACTLLVTVGTCYGLGRLEYTNDNPSDVSQVIKYTVIAVSLSAVSTSFGKLSAVVFLVRLMGIAAPRWQVRALWVLCGVMIALNIWCIFLTIGFCHPAARQWDPSVEGWCMDLKLRYVLDRAVSYRGSSPTPRGSVHRLTSSPLFRVTSGYTISTYHALMDIIIATYPAFPIRHLKISFLTKFGLCLLMGGGWL